MASSAKEAGKRRAPLIDRLAEVTRAAASRGEIITIRRAADLAEVDAAEAVEAVYASSARNAFHPTRKKKKTAKAGWLLDSLLILAGQESEKLFLVLEDAMRAQRTDKSTCFTLTDLKGTIFTRLGAILSAGEVKEALLAGRGPPTVGLLLRRGTPVFFLRADIRPVLEGAARDRRHPPEAHRAPPNPAPPEEQSFEARFEAAFDELDGARGSRNFLLLHDLRRALADVSRETFDAGLRQLRLVDRFTLLGFDGRHVQLSEEEIAAGIVEANRRLVYVARKE